jgi:hypothetical protein
VLRSRWEDVAIFPHFQGQHASSIAAGYTSQNLRAMLKVKMEQQFLLFTF